MNITSAKYVKSVFNTDENAAIKATIDNVVWKVPLIVGNAHYDAIQEWVSEGNSIEAAD
tara:strand:+ start:326 stop:502 length:177 start_codon:yes stop_codon:yes gene_type:complete